MLNFRQYLTEMPIASFQTIGKWKKPGQGWSPQDVGILTNPAAVEKIHKKWSNTKENFDFYFVQQTGASKFLEKGEVTPEWVKQNLNLDIQPNLNNITVIFTNNRGDEKIPMTAWIMAHRMGHAIRRANPNWENFTNELEKDLTRILREVYNYSIDNRYFSMTSNDIRKYRQDQNALLVLANAIGTMRSARQNNLRNFNELAYELLAQRLLTGHIKFNPLPRCITPDPRKAWGRPVGRQYCGDSDELAAWGEVLQGYADQYEHLLDGTIRSIVGKMYVM
jgi:hypothetical protein